jgi:hypothetical protein
MPEHLLDAAEVSAALEKVGGHRVPQSVWTKVWRTLGHPEGAMNDAAYDSRVDPFAALAEEHRPA